MSEVITTASEVADVAEQLRAAGTFALDLEFVPEGRYVPELALVQVGWGDVDEPEVVAIDPLAVDPRPVLELVGDPDLSTLVHAGQADLAILAGGFGIEARSVWDTQVASAFVGLGDQIGYTNALDRILGRRVDKGSQYTDWLKRPLSDKQIRYALDDVRYLPALWRSIREQLEELGRLPWVEEECARAAATADRRPTPEAAYRKVKGWGRLRGKQLGALQGLAAWREREARETNRPTSRVLQDRALVELARQAPKRVADLEAVRGLDRGLVRRHGAAMLESLQAGAGNLPPEPKPAPSDTRTDVWTVVLQAVVKAKATGADVAPRYAATRADLDELTVWWLTTDDRETEPPIALLQGWRRELVGADLLAWLSGKAALAVDTTHPSGITLRDVGVGNR